MVGYSSTATFEQPGNLTTGGCGVFRNGYATVSIHTSACNCSGYVVPVRRTAEEQAHDKVMLRLERRREWRAFVAAKVLIHGGAAEPTEPDRSDKIDRWLRIARRPPP